MGVLPIIAEQEIMQDLVHGALDVYAWRGRLAAPVQFRWVKATPSPLGEDSEGFRIIDNLGRKGPNICRNVIALRMVPSGTRYFVPTARDSARFYCFYKD